MKIPVALLLLAVMSLPALAQRERCGTAEPGPPPGPFPPSDCGYWTNNPQPEYEPSFYFSIPVVFHVIMHQNGDGYLSPTTLQDQIDILNEDFRAIAGSAGAPGTNGRIRFHLATTDPNGTPTTGITYSTNNAWYVDSGNYWTSLHWDTHRYMNIYTNAPPCCFGYVSGFPSEGIAGRADDRVVLWWEAVGREPTSGWPLNQGRTATHEAGHYLGCYHTFCGGCGSDSDCYGTGDLICDTNGEKKATIGCPSSKSSCGSPDPFHNYMDYTDDGCLWEFTPEQVNRMRCTLEHWRPDLATRSDLALDVNQNAVVDGDTLTLTTCGGIPGGLSLLVNVEVNGSPYFVQLDLGPFDGLGCRSFGGPVSAVFAGIIASFKTFGFYELGELGVSNQATVIFQ